MVSPDTLYASFQFNARHIAVGKMKLGLVRDSNRDVLFVWLMGKKRNDIA